MMTSAGDENSVGGPLTQAKLPKGMESKVPSALRFLKKEMMNLMMKPGKPGQRHGVSSRK